mmetsp:Transcript_90837/g.256050  ORF Transcript_90837/g.256050 Transcript_90837/m.256050 type:complete len:484 (-) Transcript_90837:4-1455(-)
MPQGAAVVVALRTLDYQTADLDGQRVELIDPLGERAHVDFFMLPVLLLEQSGFHLRTLQLGGRYAPIAPGRARNFRKANCNVSSLLAVTVLICNHSRLNNSCFFGFLLGHFLCKKTFQGGSLFNSFRRCGHLLTALFLAALPLRITLMLLVERTAALLSHDVLKGHSVKDVLDLRICPRPLRGPHARQLVMAVAQASAAEERRQLVRVHEIQQRLGVRRLVRAEDRDLRHCFVVEHRLYKGPCNAEHLWSIDDDGPSSTLWIVVLENRDDFLQHSPRGVVSHHLEAQALQVDDVQGFVHDLAPGERGSRQAPSDLRLAACRDVLDQPLRRGALQEPAHIDGPWPLDVHRTTLLVKAMVRLRVVPLDNLFLREGILKKRCHLGISQPPVMVLEHDTGLVHIPLTSDEEAHQEMIGPQIGDIGLGGIWRRTICASDPPLDLLQRCFAIHPWRDGKEAGPVHRDGIHALRGHTYPNHCGAPLDQNT